MLCSSSTSARTVSSTTGEGERTPKREKFIGGRLWVGSVGASGERQGPLSSIENLGGSLTGDDDFGGEVGARRGGGVGVLRTTGDDTVREGGGEGGGG